MPGRGYKKPKPELLCHYCDYVTTRPSYLEDHLRVHTGEKPFLCKVCSKAFSQKSNLGQHMKVHGAGDQTKYQCEYCQFSSKWKTSLQVHLRTHTGERPFKCKLCDRTFSQSTHCNSHMREAHEGIRSYKCPHCQKQFKRLEHLMKHKEYHSTKSYTCKHCNITFHSIWSLKKHRKKCTKCFLICSLCNEQCVDRQSLAFHYAQHCSIHQSHCSVCIKYRSSILTDNQLDKEPGKEAKKCNKMCQFCTKAFQSSFLRSIHERLFHNSKKCIKNKHFSCSYCTRIFKQKQIQLIHIRRVHSYQYAKLYKERWARHMIFKLAGKVMARQILKGQYLPTSQKTETILKTTPPSNRRGGRRDIKYSKAADEKTSKTSTRRKQAAPQKISRRDVVECVDEEEDDDKDTYRLNNTILKSFIPQPLSALGLRHAIKTKRNNDFVKTEDTGELIRILHEPNKLMDSKLI